MPRQYPKPVNTRFSFLFQNKYEMKEQSKFDLENREIIGYLR
jgi:hypothetical protein